MRRGCRRPERADQKKSARFVLLPLGSPGRRKPPRSDSRVWAVGSLCRAVAAWGSIKPASRSDSFRL